MSREDRMQSLLSALKPSLCEIKNVSARHHGHSEDDGTGETHYQIHITSEVFEGKKPLECQRLVMELLKDEFKSGLHALELKCDR